MTSHKIGSTKKLHCNSCEKKTNHEYKFVHKRVEYEEDEDSQGLLMPIFFETFEYMLWVCLGCDTVVLEEAYMIDDVIESIQYKYYPRRTLNQRVAKPYRQLDPKITRVYKEIIAGYNEGLYLTCSIGLRALLERICVNEGITDDIAWTLTAKLKLLEERKQVLANVVDALYSFKFMGDDAAHKLVAPKKQELDLALDILDDMLNILYELEYTMTEKSKRLSKYRSLSIRQTPKKTRNNK